LFSDDHEGWCALAEAAPHEQAINLLAPELRRKQPVIDKCFYRLCILTGRKTDNLKDIRERAGSIDNAFLSTYRTAPPAISAARAIP
jgi:hypothetical protein